MILYSNNYDNVKNPSDPALKMIVGSGLLANAFPLSLSQQEDVCIYAAGVSNSTCKDSNEFAREYKRLEAALQHASKVDAFVYFGTCSAADPEARNTPYVLHKLAMEQLVKAHPRNLTLRLPQVIGETPNPHTLLNFLYARILRGESFKLWNKAHRNIIDVIDVALIAQQFIEDKSFRNTTLNIANLVNYSVTDIVGTMERILKKKGVYDIVEMGSKYSIEIDAVLSVMGKAGVEFSNDYLEKIIAKYYGKTV